MKLKITHKLMIIVSLTILLIEFIAGWSSVANRYEEDILRYKDKLALLSETQARIFSAMGPPSAELLSEIATLKLIDQIEIRKDGEEKPAIRSGNWKSLPAGKTSGAGIHTIVDTAEGKRHLVSQSKFKHGGKSYVITIASDIGSIRDGALGYAIRIVGITAVIVVLVLVAILLAAMIYINRPLKKLIGMLNDIADGEGDLTRRLEIASNDEIGEIARLFNQFVSKLHVFMSGIAKHVRDQSDDANTQAASVEEISSTLEEISSMTLNNAENANRADRLMKDVNRVVDRADKAMNELTVSMSEMSSASLEASKIIKTIDEIAFQTNLLALNAAVEAARAGDAGSGFAVVAGEVRNLAVRSAEAAKSTSDIIEDTVGKIKTGTDIVGRTNTEFGSVSEISGRVGTLVAEIATASAEQARGIEQVGETVSQVDKITQQSASGAQQLAERMRAF